MAAGRSRSARTSSGKPRVARLTQKERTASTKRKLLDAATQSLREDGFSGLTSAAVAARAGITSDAIQHHYASSHELLRDMDMGAFRHGALTYTLLTDLTEE